MVQTDDPSLKSSSNTAVNGLETHKNGIGSSNTAEEIRNGLEGSKNGTVEKLSNGINKNSKMKNGFENGTDSKTVIKIQKGWIRGKICESVLGQNYYSFQGIRYAKPPLGKLRFKAPQDVEPWEGVYDATKEGSPCIALARDNDNVIGSEDCLFINVYSPKMPSGEENVPKAVMFWIHGGGLNRGSGGKELNGPDFLLHGDVVVVTFNYRLGFLGLASFEDPEIDVPGNASAKDVVKALEWVRDNISYFGGDPNNVTLFGESVGGTIIHVLSSAPGIHGLYHKIISQGGTVFLEADELSYQRKTRKFAEMLGFQSENEREVYEFVMGQPADKLVEAGALLLHQNKNRFYRTFDYVIETPARTEKNLILRHPNKYLLYEPHPYVVPMMIGSNSDEGMVHAVRPFEDRLVPPNFSNPEELVPLYYHIPKDTDQAYDVGLKIQDFYYGKEAPNRRNLEKYSKLQTDLKYRLTTKRMIKAQKKYHPQVPIYLYRFSFESPVNLYKKFFGLNNLKGVTHGDELTYLFHTKYTPKFYKGSQEETTMLRLVTFWTNFAKYNDPNPRNPKPFITTRWLPTDAENLSHLDIGKDLKFVEEQPDNDRIKFWDQLQEDLGVDWM